MTEGEVIKAALGYALIGWVLVTFLSICIIRLQTKIAKLKREIELSDFSSHYDKCFAENCKECARLDEGL